MKDKLLSRISNIVALVLLAVSVVIVLAIAVLATLGAGFRARWKKWL